MCACAFKKLIQIHTDLNCTS